MKKSILCLVMAAIMTVGTSMNVFAEKITGSKDWAVEFDGEKMNSTFDASQMSAEVYKLLPGDSCIFHLSSALFPGIQST